MAWNPADGVAAARRLRGRMSQEELAIRLSEASGTLWTRQMVADLETGRRTFKVEYLSPIAEALDVSFEFLLLGDGVASKREKMRFHNRPFHRGLLSKPLVAA